MAIIDPEGLFNGDRLRRCSNTAQLHWPRLFLASDGFARLEINYARIVGRAYPTFTPMPSETEIQSFLQEYAKNYLIFLYQADGQLWGQWDTRPNLLPKFKTKADHRSPVPPEPAFSAWKKSYREQCKALQKSFQNISAEFLHGVGIGVGIGVGKTLCASKTDARAGEPLSIDNPPCETTEPDALFPVENPEPKPKPVLDMLTAQQGAWFDEWWAEYWLRKAKKPARQAFVRAVKTPEQFERVMVATRAQKPEMLTREPGKRPYGATWLNQERWDDEQDVEAIQSDGDDSSIYTEWDPPKRNAPNA